MKLLKTEDPTIGDFCSFSSYDGLCIATATDGATVTPDFSEGNVQTLTLAGNRAMANPSNIKAGATYIIWNSSVRAVDLVDDSLMGGETITIFLCIEGS